MIVIFEGTDATGKSTQIRHLKKYFSHNMDMLFHELHYTADIVKNMSTLEAERLSKEYYFQMFRLLKAIKFCGDSVVCDRTHLGEAVYAEKYRGYSGDYVFDMERINPEITESDDTFLVVFVDDPQNLVDREDGHSLGSSISDKEDEVNRFRAAFEKSHIKNKKLIDINGKDEYDVWREIIDFLVYSRREEN